MKRLSLLISVVLLCLAALAAPGNHARAQQNCGAGQTYKPACGACVADSPAPGTACSPPANGTIGNCGSCACSSGKIQCGTVCQTSVSCSPACATGQTCDACTGACQGKAYALVNPDSAQSGDLNIATGHSYKVNGEVPYVSIGGATMTGPLTVNAKITTNTQMESTVATGTAPLKVASTTRVDNLNADLLDGSHSSAFAASTHNHDAAYVNIGGDTMTGTLTARKLLAYGSTGNDIVKIQPGNDSNPTYNAIVVGNAAWSSWPFQVNKRGDVTAAAVTAAAVTVGGVSIGNEFDVGNGGSSDTLYINGNSSAYARCCNMAFGPPMHCVQYCFPTFLMASTGVNHKFGVESSDGSVWSKGSFSSSGASLIKTDTGKEFIGRSSSYWYIARNGTDTANQLVLIGGGSNTDLIITGNLYVPNNSWYDMGCHWVGWFSEEGGHEGVCNNGEFITSVECGGSNCDSLSIYCCGV